MPRDVVKNHLMRLLMSTDHGIIDLQQKNSAMELYNTKIYTLQFEALYN